jgi:hypothetical protein
MSKVSRPHVSWRPVPTASAKPANDRVTARSSYGAPAEGSDLAHDVLGLLRVTTVGDDDVDAILRETHSRASSDEEVSKGAPYATLKYTAHPRAKDRP